MKKISLALLVASSFIYGCTKTTTEYYTTTAPQTDDSVYVISGLTDLNLYRNSKDSLMLSITKPLNKQDRVTMAVSGLPTGVTATITPNGGYPPFDAKIVFTAKEIAVGDYPITVTASTDAGILKTFSIILHVTLKSDCSGEIVGSYVATSLCSTSGSQTNSVFIGQTSTKNRVQFSNLWPLFNTFTADVNCSNSNIVIPSQVLQFSTDTISGGGTYNEDSVVITYTIKYSGGGSETCSTVFK